MNLETMVAGIGPAGKIPPLQDWNPGHSGEMDLCITADGRWIHDGHVIRRAALVRLLASILRREDDGHYYLVTPQEKQRIHVEDHPFIIIDADQDRHCQNWWLTTQYGDRIRLDDEHRLRVTQMPSDDAVPEVPVRFGMAARLGRNVFYRLVEQAVARPNVRDNDPGWGQLVLTSGGAEQPLGRLDEAP